MGRIKSLNKWANAHTYIPLDVLRIALGIFLFIKGTSFISDSQKLVELIEPLKGMGGSMLLIHYIAPAHIIGGILICFGLLTRWASIAQIPILIGAVLINIMIEADTTSLILSLTVLALLLFFTIYGSGRHSADYYFKMQM